MRLAIGMVKPFKMVNAGTCSMISIHLPTSSGSTSATLNLSRGSNKLKITNTFNSLGSQCFEGIKAAKLHDKWMECQGIKNWEGLLDPLDDDLRSEILRYGEFVEAAYRSFDFDTKSSTYATNLYPENSMLTECGLGTSGYRVSKSLHATCSVRVPRWIERFPNWGSRQSSWIGYVAVCDDKDEIARLGRRDVVISYRGTATCLEWLENLRATLTCLPDDMAPNNCEAPMVQSGFLSMYTTRDNESNLSLQDTVRQEIDKILQTYCDEPLSITITGHSLGAALATLTAFDITNKFPQAPLVTVVSFGGPRVGNRTFRCQLEKTGTKVLRIVNSDDPITKVPGFVIDDDDMPEQGAIPMAGFPAWIQKRVEDTQWVYAEVGKELRLSSRDCPHLDKGNVATCHDLKTYLHLVNNFVSSTCPFRATAKRVLSRTKQEKQQLLFR